MTDSYTQQGYLVLKDFFQVDELDKLRALLLVFHGAWQRQNTDFYATKAINSAGITGSEFLSREQRASLFRFLGSSKLSSVLTEVVGVRPAFMNTQLFFNPVNPSQHNYWHRDPQYHLSIDEQKAALHGPEVVHFRIPLFDEPGIELVPGSHRHWDTEEELSVRLGLSGRSHHEALASGVTVPLAAGDLLVFSARMIHRGLYGMSRLALDVLFCDPDPGLLKFVSDDYLPEPDILASLEYADAFRNTIEIKARTRKCE